MKYTIKSRQTNESGEILNESVIDSPANEIEARMAYYQAIKETITAMCAAFGLDASKVLNEPTGDGYYWDMGRYEFRLTTVDMDPSMTGTTYVELCID